MKIIVSSTFQRQWVFIPGDGDGDVAVVSMTRPVYGSLAAVAMNVPCCDVFAKCSANYLSATNLYVHKERINIVPWGWSAWFVCLWLQKRCTVVEHSLPPYQLGSSSIGETKITLTQRFHHIAGRSVRQKWSRPYSLADVWSFVRLLLYTSLVHCLFNTTMHTSFFCWVTESLWK